jgi:hypothetical protein
MRPDRPSLPTRDVDTGCGAEVASGGPVQVDRRIDDDHHPIAIDGLRQRDDEGPVIGPGIALIQQRCVVPRLMERVAEHFGRQTDTALEPPNTRPLIAGFATALC